MTKKKKQDNQQEIDIFSFMQNTYICLKRLIKQTINFVAYLLTKWKILLTIIFISSALGLLYENKNKYSPEKEGSLLVRFNHGSSIYFYNSVDLLKQKVVSGDTNFFNETLQFEEGEQLLDISLNPVISSKDFFGLFTGHDEMKVLINNTENLNETIKYDIKQHKISFLLSSGSSDATVDKIIRYLSSSPTYKSLANIFVEERLSLIEQNKTTIDQINKLIEKQTSKDIKKTNTAQLYVDDDGSSLAEILNLKTRLKKEIADYRNELIVKQDPFFVYSPQVELLANKKTLGKKTILFPVLGLALFVLFYLAKKVFLRINRSL